MALPAGRDSHPLVTVVTPTLNQGKFIEETIRSVLGQDYPAIEYIVVDGGSTDQTLEILARYNGRLQFISERDKGQTDAINKGFRRAGGEILAYLNSDDTYLPGAVTTAVAALASDPACPFVYGEGYHTDESGRILERYPTEDFSRARLAETCFICQPTVFIRRRALEEIGYLDDRLQYCMDYDLWLRLSEKAPGKHINQFLATSRLYAGGKTVGQRRKCHWEIARMLRGHLGQVPSSWVYALAHAVVETRLRLDRSRNLSNALFVGALTVLSAYLFVFFNGRIQAKDRAQMKGWIHGAGVAAYRRLLQRKAPGD